MHEQRDAKGGVCWACRQGRYNLDPNIKFFSLPPVHGALRKFVDHPADFCFKLPSCLTFEQGALVEPLSIAGAMLPRFRAISAASRTNALSSAAFATLL